MSTSGNASIVNPEKAFRADDDLDNTIDKGCRRVVSAYYHKTEMSQTRAQESVANGLTHVIKICEDVAKRSKEGEAEFEKAVQSYDDDTVERVILEGVAFAVTNSTKPTGVFDDVLLKALPTIKDLNQYYGATDGSANLSQPSDDGP